MKAVRIGLHRILALPLAGFSIRESRHCPSLAEAPGRAGSAPHWLKHLRELALLIAGFSTKESWLCP